MRAYKATSYSLRPSCHHGSSSGDCKRHAMGPTQCPCCESTIVSSMQFERKAVSQPHVPACRSAVPGGGRTRRRPAPLPSCSEPAGVSLNFFQPESSFRRFAAGYLAAASAIVGSFASVRISKRRTLSNKCEWRPPIAAGKASNGQPSLLAGAATEWQAHKQSVIQGLVQAVHGHPPVVSSLFEAMQ